jgi:serine/threonine protein kinase
MDCGYLIQAEAAGAEEGAPNLCPNPACGVANPPGERNCQRCGTPLPTPPGTVLHGRYRIERLLAMGGFGAVYLATDVKAHNRPVAIKDMICADPQEFAIRLNFFRREADILRSLESVPIVPRVYDLIEQGQTAHLVMEFIRGQDLLKLMEANNNRPFPLHLVIEWGMSVCDVLAHMHTQSPPLVHRDLKPDNIMLLQDQRSIKLIDFGTARDLGRTQKEKMAAKTRVYTEGYAPPEQIVGKPEPRSDLFALAGTMYHLATGKAPEGFYTARELEAQLAEADGSWPADQRWFFELIRINLAEDVNERYFSAREIKADLEGRRVTREVACPRCQHVNKVRQPYCGKCAEPLTDPTPPCHHCGKTNRMGSRCCIQCGNRLR